MKGIIMAGGRGTRLFPSTIALNKHLLPVYNKPMIYYPLATLLLAGIRDILVVTNVNDRAAFQQLLGNGTQWGIEIHYACQQSASGIADGLLLSTTFINNDRVCLILGDNVFHGSGLEEKLSAAGKYDGGATIFAYHVDNPQDYGVIEFDSNKHPIALTEKPQHPKSSYASTGLYFYDTQVIDIAKSLKPSPRGELEITDINTIYLSNNKQLYVQTLGRGFAWLDMGTHQSLLHAANFVEVIESRQGFKIGCPEEIAWHKGFINDEQLLECAHQIIDHDYQRYLVKLLQQ